MYVDIIKGWTHVLMTLLRLWIWPRVDFHEKDNVWQQAQATDKADSQEI